MQGNLANTHLPAFVSHRNGEKQQAAFKPFRRLLGPNAVICRAKQNADADLQLVKREETSDGAILFVFGDEAAVAANKSAEAAQAPAPEPEAAYEEARIEKVHEGAAAAGDESATLSNGALIPDFSEDPEDPDELLSDEDAPDLQDEIAKTLTSLRVADLKEMCKERKITGYSKMRKSQLVRVLKDAMLVDSE